MGLKRTGSRRQHEVKDLTTLSFKKKKLKFPVSLFKRNVDKLYFAFGLVCFFGREREREHIKLQNLLKINFAQDQYSYQTL